MLDLSPSLLNTAASFDLLAESLVDGFIQGMHRSPFKGSSQEFASYRPYQPGDPVKLVDWKLWARSDSLFVREYEEETNFCGHLFLDGSKSMDHGDDGQNKFLYGRILCAVLSLLMARQKDAPGFALLAGEGQESLEPHLWIPPSTRQDSMDHLMHTLSEIPASGKLHGLGDVTPLLEEINGRSLAIIISDGFFPLEQGRDFLDQLKTRGLETLFFHVMHREEIDPKFDGDMLLVDSETDAEVPIDGDALRETYAQTLAEFFSSMENLCHETETDYCRVITDEPLDQALQTYLEKRNVS